MEKNKKTTTFAILPGFEIVNVTFSFCSQEILSKLACKKFD